MRLDNLSPTPFDELNAVLAEFVRALSALLGDSLIGAYLQGSFAVGDFDERSDVDFMIVTRKDITESNLPALQALHAVIYERPSRWAQHLEGSYAPAAALKQWAETPRDPPGLPPRPSSWVDPGTSGSPPRVYPFLFLKNGANALVRSEHDNTRVVRWVTREKGIVLSSGACRRATTKRRCSTRLPCDTRRPSRGLFSPPPGAETVGLHCTDFVVNCRCQKA